MHVLLVTAGSHGDINPFIALGCALKARGHTVRMLVNPYYRHQIEEAGLVCEPCGESIDLKAIGEQYPDIMHPTRGAGVVVNAMIVPMARETFRRVQEIDAQQRIDAVVAHCVCPGAMWAAEVLGIPCAHVALAPINWVSRHEPVVGARFMPAAPPLFVARMLRALMVPIITRTFDVPLTRLRRELGLPPRTRHIMHAMRGGALNLALWSPQFRAQLPDDPAGGRICGFAWHDRHGEVEAPPADVQQFIREGDAPVLFCLGTAAVHVAGDFYDQAAEACRLLGRRGLLLVGPGRGTSRALPAGVRAFAYAPFSTVMPQCAANVHHGGVGSTGQALRAGRPMVVIPHAHDQWDNAARVLRMGVSRTLPRPRVTASRLAGALRAVLQAPAAAVRAADIGRRMAGEDGAATAATHVEALAAQGRQSARL